MSYLPLAEIEPIAESAIPETRRVIANFPDGLAAFDQMYERMVGHGRLDATLRLVILGASARWRSDPYIAGAMFTQAMHEGIEREALAALIADAEGGEPTTAEGVLLAFCRKSTETAFKMVAADVERLKDSGWTNGQIVEAVTMVSLSGYMTVMSAAGGLLDDPTLDGEPWR